jgi:hypothetical protein
VRGGLPVFECLSKLKKERSDGVVDGELKVEFVGIVGEVLTACGFSL